MAEINIILFVGVFFLVAAVLFSKIIVLQNNLTKRILPHSRLCSKLCSSWVFIEKANPSKPNLKLL